jgi:hypothetical protein
VAKPLTCKVWAKILKLIYKLQIGKKNKECKPKRLSWAAYNALEREKGEGILHHYSWMIP